jgi:hypothetical protein
MNEDCGQGMYCNTCPSVCQEGADACDTVCGTPVCEPADSGTAP